MGVSHDVEAIRAVLDRYATAVDRRDWALMHTCFTEDCCADYGQAGAWTAREPFVTWLDEIHRDVGPTMHRITNHDVHVDGDVARATCYFDALLRVEHRGFDLLHVVGSYVDALVRTPDGWRIADRRTENYLWRREQA